MTLEVRGDIPRDVLEQIEALTASQRTLEDVIAWSLGLRPPLLIQEIVTQDEYTHDVVLPYRDGVYLVYDTT